MNYTISPIIIQLTNNRRIVLTGNKTKAMADDEIRISLARDAINDLIYRTNGYEWPLESEPNCLEAMRERLNSSTGAYSFFNAILNYPRFQYPDGHTEAIEPQDLEPIELPIICQIEKPITLDEKTITTPTLTKALQSFRQYLESCGRFSATCKRISARANLIIDKLIRGKWSKEIISYDELKPIIDISEEMYIEMNVLDVTPEELRIHKTGPAKRQFIGFAKDKKTAFQIAKMFGITIESLENIPEKDGKSIKLVGYRDGQFDVTDEELDRIARIMVISFEATKEMHQSILENKGTGRYACNDFDRSDLFHEANIEPALKVFQPMFIQEIERCGSRIQQYHSEICDVIGLATEVDNSWRSFFKSLKKQFRGVKAIIEAEAAILKLTENYLTKLCTEGGDLHISSETINSCYNTFVAKLPELAACISQEDAKKHEYAETSKGHKTIITEINHHITEEANRIIACKAPKRKKKYGHEGNGHKGPKTSYMEKQRKTFQAWLDHHPESIRGKKTKISAARRCWMEHQQAWDKARTAEGDKRGYSSPKALSASCA